MQCKKCRSKIDSSLQRCPRCGAELGSRAIWGIIGLSFIVIAIGILIGTVWFVEHKRVNRQNSAPIIKSSIITPATPLPVTLASMSKQEILKLLPVSMLSQFISSGGEHLPDDLRVIGDETDQYLVLLGSRATDEGKRERMMAVFKMESGSLSDISRQLLPPAFSSGRLGDELTSVRFFNKGGDIELTAPVSRDGGEVLEECFACDHAYINQELNWCETDYQLGSKHWHNDPYTALYLTAQALNRKSVDITERLFIDASLDAEIERGFEREPNQPWRAQNITSNDPEELKLRDSISYSMGNGVKAVTITVTKQNGQWLATAIEREQ